MSKINTITSAGNRIKITTGLPACIPIISKLSALTTGIPAFVSISIHATCLHLYIYTHSLPSLQDYLPSSLSLCTLSALITGLPAFLSISVHTLWSYYTGILALLSVYIHILCPHYRTGLPACISILSKLSALITGLPAFISISIHTLCPYFRTTCLPLYLYTHSLPSLPTCIPILCKLSALTTGIPAFTSILTLCPSNRNTLPSPLSLYC